MARYLVSLRSFYKFAMMEELVRLDPTENLESPKIRQSLPTYLRVDEVDRLAGGPDVSTPIGLRDRAMLEVLYSTGLRVSELLNLRLSDVDMRMGCVRCIGKGDKERLVPIGRKAIAAVEQYLALSRPQFARPGSPPPHNQVLFLTQARPEAEPRQHLEDHARLRSPSWVCADASLRINCVTVLPRTCWNGARTCVRSSSCWATRIFPRLRFTRTWSRSA